MAVKAAVAAALAWMLVQPIDGVAERYPYYAPFGAVVAVSTTVASSARTSAQSVVAILCGAAVAVAVEAWLGQGAGTVALVVALGTVLGGWRGFGAMSGWVPIAGLFVLILGAAQPGHFVLAYAGLTAFGAVIGVAINMAFPPLPLNVAEESLGRLRDTLARQFDELAESLLAERPVSTADWESRSHALEEAAAESRQTVQRATDAQRGNWRARRWRDQAQRQYAAALTLEQLPFLAQDVTAILIHETRRVESVPWGHSLRPRIAHALQAVADLLRSIGASGAGAEEVAIFDEVLDRLVAETTHVLELSDDDLFGVGSVIVALRRLRASVVSDEE